MATQQIIQPKLVRNGEGLYSENPSERAWTKLTSAETGGQFLVAEIETQPGFGPPYHIHEREDELFYILSGEVEFLVDGEKLLAKAGDTVFGPRNVPHRFQGAGNAPARMLVTVTGSNFEAFYCAWEAAQAKGITEEEGAALAAEYGIHFLPEPA
jgi:quercetin dioxygenase-like cupin family protein